MKLDKKKRIECMTEGSISVIDISGSYFFNTYKCYDQNSQMRTYWVAVGNYLNDAVKSIDEELERKDLAIHE